MAVLSLKTRVETPRLVLRPPRGSDVAAVVAAQRRNAAHLEPWSPRRAAASLATVARDVAALRRAWSRDESYGFVAFRRDDASIVGRVTLSGVARGPFQNALLGYWIDAERQGDGLATEAARGVVGLAFGALALHRVQAGVMPRNAASAAVLRKLGFRYEGLAPRYLQIAGVWEDHELYAVTAEEWTSPRSPPA